MKFNRNAVAPFLSLEPTRRNRLAVAIREKLFTQGSRNGNPGIIQGRDGNRNAVAPCLSLEPHDATALRLPFGENSLPRVAEAATLGSAEDEFQPQRGCAVLESRATRRNRLAVAIREKLLTQGCFNPGINRERISTATRLRRFLNLEPHDATALRLLFVKTLTQGSRSGNPGLWDVTASR